MLKKIRTTYQKWEAKKTQLKETNRMLYFGVDTIETLLVALFFALLIRKYIIMTSVVPTGSMIPTLMVQDRLFVNKYIYRFTDPKRGDIIVFKSPRKDKKDYVKRCIGLPGDKVAVKKGIVYINGSELILPGINVQYDYSYFDEVTVPTGNYFMMGDNREHSWDSRFWAAAGLSSFVPRRDVLGKALFTFWPFNRMRVLK